MHRHDLFATLALTLALLGILGARATIAADAAPDGSGIEAAVEPAVIAVPGTELWSLRSDRLPAAMPMTPRAKVIPVSEMPNERRSVRIVYHGYGEANLLRTER